jgi:hypothetical protein
VTQKKDSAGYAAIIELLKSNTLSPEQKMILAGQIAKVEQVKANVEAIHGRFKVVAERNAGRRLKKNSGTLHDD